MEVALRSSSGLTIPQCYDTAGCRAVTDVVCYTTGYFTEFCKRWRAYVPGGPGADLPAPPAVSAPVIDVNPNSPTYGQATVDGHVVATPQDAGVLLDQQIAQQAAAERAAIEAAINREAAAACTVTAKDCGIFQSVNSDCECKFDPGSPMFIGVVIAAMAVLIAWKQKR